MSVFYGLGEVLKWYGWLEDEKKDFGFSINNAVKWNMNNDFHHKNIELKEKEAIQVSSNTEELRVKLEYETLTDRERNKQFTYLDKVCSMVRMNYLITREEEKDSTIITELIFRNQ